MFDKYLTANDVERPVVVLTDGHSSRYDVDVLRFCEEKKIRQFVSPPDTTGLLQPLDQINSMLHSSYRKCLENKFDSGVHLNRESFMLILAEIWPNWASTDSVKNSFKRCGITDTDLQVDYMQQDKFTSAKLITPEDPQNPDSGSSSAAGMDQGPKLPDIPSPQSVRRGTAQYWKAKFDSLKNSFKSVLEKPIDANEIPELTPIEKFKSKKAKN